MAVHRCDGHVTRGRPEAGSEVGGDVERAGGSESPSECAVTGVGFARSTERRRPVYERRGCSYDETDQEPILPNGASLRGNDEKA